MKSVPPPPNKFAKVIPPTVDLTQYEASPPTLEVYYVTAVAYGANEDEKAVHAAAILAAFTGAPVAPQGQREKVRIDVAKFFSERAAIDHAGRLASGWYDPRVERRTEKVSEQHPAHRVGL